MFRKSTQIEKNDISWEETSELEGAIKKMGVYMSPTARNSHISQKVQLFSHTS